MCLEINKVYGNGMAMLGSLAMCTVYTNTFSFGQLKLRLGLFKTWHIAVSETGCSVY